MVSKHTPLENFKVILADSDQKLMNVLKHMMENIGFRHIHATQTGKAALDLVKQEAVDFVITDWQLKDMHSSTMLQHVRRNSATPNLTLPIIMLTGRAEKSDVEAARDMGINEYVVKPFSAQTIFKRLERIVEFPRYFVLTSEYIGPDRRNKTIATLPSERRTARVLPERKPWDASRELLQAEKPKLWLPDFSLKHKLGHNVELKTLITPAVLSQAQAAIDNISSESLQWIKEDLNQLLTLCNVLESSSATPALLNEMAEVTLIVSSRAGTFGYMGASRVAYMLYLMCRNAFTQNRLPNASVLRKHIEVLQLLFGKGVKGQPAMIHDVIRELQLLSSRYA